MHPQERQGGKSYCSGAVHVLKLDTSAKRKTARKVSGIVRVPFPTARPRLLGHLPPSFSPWGQVFPGPLESKLDAHILQRVFSKKKKNVFFLDHITIVVKKLSVD